MYFQKNVVRDRRVDHRTMSKRWTINISLYRYSTCATSNVRIMMPDDPFPYLRYTQKTHIPPTNPNIIKLVRPNIFSASHEYGFLGSVLHYQFTPHYFENLVYETNNSREDNCSKTDEHRSKCDFSRGVPDDPFFLLNTTRKQHTSPPPKKK